MSPTALGGQRQGPVGSASGPSSRLGDWSVRSQPSSERAGRTEVVVQTADTRCSTVRSPSAGRGYQRAGWDRWRFGMASTVSFGRPGSMEQNGHVKAAIRLLLSAAAGIALIGIWALPASASFTPPTATCRKALSQHTPFSRELVSACLASDDQTFTPSPCPTKPEIYIFTLKGRTYAIRAGHKILLLHKGYTLAQVDALCR